MDRDGDGRGTHLNSTRLRGGLVAGLAVVVLFLRQSGEQAFSTLYAEDGTVFYQTAIDGGSLELLRGWAGYLHVVPRTMAAVVSVLPAGWAAAAFALFSATTVVALAGYVFVAARGVVEPVAGRLLLAAAFVLIPVGQEEVLLNVANLHWFMMAAAAWAFVDTSERRGQRAAGAAIVLLAALSDPLSVFLVPVALLRVTRARFDILRVPAAIALVVGLAVQAVAIVFADIARSGDSETLEPASMAGWFLVRVVGRLFLGPEVLDDPSAASAVLASAVICLPLAVLAVELWRRGRSSLAPVVMLGGSGVLSFALTVGIAGKMAPRYAVTPGLLLWSALVVAVCGISVSERRTVPLRAAVAVLAVAVVVGWSTSFRVDNRRGDGPTWVDGLDIAESECLAAGVEAVDVPITPVDDVGWSVRVDCDDL